MRRTDPLNDKLLTATELAELARHHLVAGDVSSVVGDLVRLIDTAQSAQRIAVGLLRARGESWEQVGDALGISRQAAHKTYGP